MSGDITGKKLLPIGDRLVLREVEAKDGVVLMGGNVQAVVVAAGPGLPYGRGEYYENQAKAGMTIYIPRKAWDEADSIQWGRDKLRVVHERQCLAGIVDE